MAKEIKRGDIIQTKDKTGYNVYSLVLAGPFKNGIFQVARLSTWNDFDDCRDLEVYNAYTKQTEHVNIFSMLTTTWADRVTAIVGTVDEVTMRRIAGAMYRVVSGLYEYSPEKGYHICDFAISIPASMLFRFGIPGEVDSIPSGNYGRQVPTIMSNKPDVPDDDAEYQACPFTVNKREGPDGRDIPIGVVVQDPDGKIVTMDKPRSGGFDKSGAASTKAMQPANPESKPKKTKAMSKKAIEAHNDKLMAKKQSDERITKFKESIDKIVDNNERLDLIFDIFSDPRIPEGRILISAAAKSVIDLAEYPPIRVRKNSVIVDKTEFVQLMNSDPNICNVNSKYAFMRVDGSRETANYVTIALMIKNSKIIYTGKSSGVVKMETYGNRLSHKSEKYPKLTIEGRIDKIFSTGTKGERTQQYLQMMKKFILENSEMIPMFARGIDIDKWVNPIDLQMICISLSYPGMRYIMVAKTLYEYIYKMTNSEIEAFVMIAESISCKGQIKSAPYGAQSIKYIACFAKWASLYPWTPVNTKEEAEKRISEFDGMFHLKDIGYNIGLRGSKIMGKMVGISEDAMCAVMLQINKDRQGKKQMVGYANMLQSNTDKLLIAIEEKTKISLDPTSPSVKRKKFTTSIKKGSVQ